MANAVNLRQLGKVPGPRGRDLAQGRIVEHDVRRHARLGGDRPARCAQRFEQRIGRTGVALAPVGVFG